MTNSMISYKTTFESTNNLPMQIAIGHGENADLIASFKDEGVDVNLTGYTARAIYQPKSKWGTDDWYELPCEISENTVVAHWGNTYDNGDNAVKLFMHLVKDGKLAYPAIYQIRLFETPGFTPSAIEPIPETIDFSQYTLLNAPWVLPADVPYSVRSIEVDSSYSPSSPYECNTWEIVGITVPSGIEETLIGVKLPQRNPNKGIDFYVTLQNRTDHAVHLGVVTPSWYEPYAMRSWEPIFEDGLNSLDINAGDTACFHFRETGTISPDFGSRYQMLVEKAGYEIKTVYSETPRFSEWVPVNYTFTVEWRNNLSSWVFIFNGTLINDNTEGWTDPLATHLETNYGGIGLEANRERLDYWYVIGTQTTKPLQPYGDYATHSDLSSSVSTLTTQISAVNSSIPYTLRSVIIGDNGLVSPVQREVLGFWFNATTSSSRIQLPDAISGVATDFIVDVNNNNENTLSCTLINNGWGQEPNQHHWVMAVDSGQTLSNILSFNGNVHSRLFFTEVGYNQYGNPILHVSRKDIDIISDPVPVNSQTQGE